MVGTVTVDYRYLVGIMAINDIIVAECGRKRSHTTSSSNSSALPGLDFNFIFIQFSEPTIQKVMGTGSKEDGLVPNKLRRPLSSSYSTAFLPMREGTRTM